MKNILIFTVLTIFLIGIISGADFIPQGNINLKDIYNITNGVNAEFDCIEISGDLQCAWPTVSGGNYTAGSNLTLTGTEFSVNTNALKNWLDTIYQAIGNYLTQAIADTLYAGIEWDYNQTAPAMTYEYNQTALAGSNISVSGRTVSINAPSLKNWLDTIYQAIGSYFTKTEVTNMIDGNISNVNINIQNNYTALDNLKLNKTDQRYNETNYINNIISNKQNYSGNQCPTGNYSYGYNQNGTPICRSDASGMTINGTTLSINNITNFNYNLNQTPIAGTNITVSGRTVSVNILSLKTYFDTIYNPLGNYLTQAVADTLYSSISSLNTASINLQSNITAVNSTLTTKLNKAGDTMTGNLNMSANLTMNNNYFCLNSDCSKFICSNSTTIVISNNGGINC